MKRKYFNTDADNDFYLQLGDNFRLSTVLITYRLPDYYSILNEFMWQTLDHPPDYPRIYRFLDFWEKNIEAPIHSVQIDSVSIISPANFEKIDQYFKI